MTIASSVEPQSLHCVPDDLVADHLAGQLRYSRLTVLYGATSQGVSQFIATSVAPRLARRRWDRNLTRARQGEFRAATQAGRTSRRHSSALAELPVLIDRWTGPAIPTLRKRISDSFESAGAYMTSVSLPIADSLSAWSRLLDLRFLIIFDRFDEFLAAHAESDDGRGFTDEFVQVLRRPGLPVNFLLCAAVSSEPEMQRYQTQFAGLAEDSCVRLPLHRSSVPASVSDLTVIEWREPLFGDESANPGASDNRPHRARGGLRGAWAATITAIAMFCWPTVLQPDIRFDAAEYLTLAGRAIERGVSDLFHRL